MSSEEVVTNSLIILELTYPSTAEQDVLRHPALKPRGRRPRARKLERVWHDTVDFQLAHRDLALSEYAGQWHLDRLGLGWPRRPGTAAALIADAINPAGIEAELGEALPGPLRSVTRFTGEILRLPITLDGGPAECRILRGTLFALGLSGEASAPHPVYRMEIEATAAAAVDLAQQLAADLPVQPAVATLPHEALLLRGTRIKAPPAPPLDPGMATEDALAIIASGFVTTFLTRLGQIPGRSGPEPVHQARVTMRRLRALMLAFRPILKDSEDRVKDLLVELKAVLGPARDWDVFLSETVAPIAASLPEDQPAMLWLRDAAEAQRESAYAALIAYQHQADYRALLWQLAALCLGVGWRHFAPSVPEQQEQPDGPSVAAGAAPPPPLAADPKAEGDMSRLGEFALRCIDGRWKKTARPLRDVIPMPVTELHQLRIKCKKLRYQAEMFQDALPGKAARKLVRRLTNTQEIMGELNDGAVAGDLAESLRPKTRTTAREQVLAAEATGLVRGYGLGRASGSREAVIAAWRKLVKSNPF